MINQRQPVLEGIRKKVDFKVLCGFLETYQTDHKKPLVWRNHTKAKGWKIPGHILVPDFFKSFVVCITLCTMHITLR